MTKSVARRQSRNAITLTRELACAAGTDAANAFLRARGADKWSRLEWNIGVAVTNRLCGHLHADAAGRDPETKAFHESVAKELYAEADGAVAWLAEQGVVQKGSHVLAFRFAA